MPLRRLPLLALALPLLLAAPPAAAALTTQGDLDRVVNGFYAGTTIDPDAAYTVKDLVITKDIATFTLKSGTLYLTKPVEGFVLSAAFIGEGFASIKPIRPMDRMALDLSSRDHFGRAPGGELATKFDKLVLVSLDDSIRQLVVPAGSPIPSPDRAGAESLLADRFQLMRDLELPLDLELLALLSNVPNRPSLLSFHSADYDWLEYAFQPQEQFEVSLVSAQRLGNTVRPRPLILTHRTQDFDSRGNYTATLETDQKLWIDVQNYKLDITIPDTSHFLVEGQLTFTPVIDDLRIIPFSVVNNVLGRRSTDKQAKKLTLKAFRDADGKELPFVHRKNQAWVLPPEPLHAGRSYTYHFSIDAETIIQISSAHYFIINDAPWYPQHGYTGGLYTMDWTVKSKKPLYPTGSGRMVKETTEGAFNVTQLVFDKPVWLPFLIFGSYQKQSDVYRSATDGTEVALNVFYAPRTSFTVEDNEGDFVSVDVTVPSGKPKDILGEAKEIMKLYESFFGPFPFAQLQVAQMSPGMGFGQGPAGFIQLTGEAFMSSSDIASFSLGNADFFHGFFSHEMAHQYWGHAIKWGSDEDVWLSESFAEYTSGLFILGLLGQERFQGQLKEWRDNAKIADPHAPIAWAGNLRGENAGTWRTGLLYNKGPYVVHMLRMQVGHENYVKAMKSLMGKYGHKQITTDQLMQEFEAVVGYKLDYFFGQWFRGTGIPVFNYSSDVRQSEDGKWVATVKISQRDKQNFKVVSMPVFFHFGKDKVLVKERPILKADDVYQIKLPEKPQKISLDDYRTLLADFVEQGATGQ